jgi:excisionase family DNA binding protein
MTITDRGTPDTVTGLTLEERVERMEAMWGEIATHLGPATNEFLSPEDLAAELRVPLATVYGWRYKGTGPRALKVGRHVRYRREDVDAWLDAQAAPRPAAGHADMGDPLAPFRLPDGSVAYLSIPVGGLRAGDWFQRQRGDDGWHQVRPLIFGGDQVGVPFDETGLEWFGRDQMVRVARTPEHVVAAQERRWETGR